MSIAALERRLAYLNERIRIAVKNWRVTAAHGKEKERKVAAGRIEALKKERAKVERDLRVARAARAAKHHEGPPNMPPPKGEADKDAPAHEGAHDLVKYKHYLDLMWAEPLLSAKRARYEKLANAERRRYTLYWRGRHKHYLKLMWKEGLLTKKRAHYEKLANDALKRLTFIGRIKARKGKAGGGKAAEAARRAAAAAAAARAKRLREQAARIREQAAMARRRHDYAANLRHIQNAERLERQARTEEINQGQKGPVEWSPTTDSEHVAAKERGEGGGREEAAEEKGEGKEAAEEKGEEKDGGDDASNSKPWYRRPIVWIGLVALGGVAVFARPKGGFKFSVRGPKGGKPPKLVGGGGGGKPSSSFRVKRRAA